MINIRMDEDEVLDLLMERVRYWTDDEEIIALFEEMYSNNLGKILKERRNPLF